ncbi:hypothetical protein OSB04_029294 [Centaurea solstitialis]|uniref:Uncharacterized protein n=1 Tax=Centaurea solstitialis TaxID=347529 RepID=A0AA38SI51_9ASTR|nr:hypothetical protein OSB04_029294 [Centaurea solstitialis]
MEGNEKKGNEKSYMEDFEKKVRISEEAMDSNHLQTIALLRKFLAVQQSRAEAYAKLKKFVFFTNFSIFDLLMKVLTVNWIDMAIDLLRFRLFPQEISAYYVI